MDDRVEKYANPAQRDSLRDDEIDLKEIFVKIWQGKYFILCFVIACTALSILFAVNMENIYKSEVVVVSANQQQSGMLSGQLGGLAALAGVNIGSSSGVDKTTLAIEILKSRDFISKFIEKKNILVELMAVSSWDATSNTMVIDEDLYDVANKSWIRKVKFPKKQKPSLQEAYVVFTKAFGLEKDAKTGVIVMSFKHYSPYFSKQVLDWLVQDINEKMKVMDIDESKRSIAYLERQIKETSISEVKSTLFSLIEEQVKNLMLANTRREYMFKVVDPSLVPEEKFAPKRSLIVAMSVFLAGLLAVISVLLFPFLRKQAKTNI